MLKTAEAINSHFGDKDYIGKWENLIGKTFELDTYEIVLCSSIKNGVKANSLGYDRVVFFHETPSDALLQFISHEIGTHLFICMLKEVYNSNRFEFFVLYEGYECLARYYNTLILKESPLEYPMSTFHIREYLDIYGRLHNAEPNISPKQLMIKGIEQFQKKAAAK